MGRLEAVAYAFLSVPPMYVFLNEVLLLSGKLGLLLLAFTLAATFSLLYLSIMESAEYIEQRIKDPIKAAHAAGFLNVFSFSLALMRIVERTSNFSPYTRLLVVRFVAMLVPLVVTFFRSARR